MLCNAIEYLSNKAKQESADPSSSTFVSHLTPQQHATVVGLVGKRCTVKGEINGQKIDVLWDTGAQVSLISDQLVRRNFPGVTIKNISELLNSELNLTTANGVAPQYLLDLIKIKVSSRYQLRSYRGILLMDNTYRTKKTLGDRALENVAPKYGTDSL